MKIEQIAKELKNNNFEILKKLSAEDFQMFSEDFSEMIFQKLILCNEDKMLDFLINHPNLKYKLSINKGYRTEVNSILEKAIINSNKETIEVLIKKINPIRVFLEISGKYKKEDEYKKELWFDFIKTQNYTIKEINKNLSQHNQMAYYEKKEECKVNDLLRLIKEHNNNKIFTNVLENYQKILFLEEIKNDDIELLKDFWNLNKDLTDKMKLMLKSEIFIHFVKHNLINCMKYLHKEIGIEEEIVKANILNILTVNHSYESSNNKNNDELIKYLFNNNKDWPDFSTTHHNNFPIRFYFENKNLNMIKFLIKESVDRVDIFCHDDFCFKILFREANNLENDKEITNNIIHYLFIEENIKINENILMLAEDTPYFKWLNSIHLDQMLQIKGQKEKKLKI